jgi:hypothetical protein
MIERHLRMVLAAFVISLAAMFRRGAMALCRALVFLRGCGVRVNYVGVFVHGNAPLYVCLIAFSDQCV